MDVVCLHGCLHSSAETSARVFSYFTCAYSLAIDVDAGLTVSVNTLFFLLVMCVMNDELFDICCAVKAL